MIHYYKTLNKSEKVLYGLAIAIILLGIALRIIVWAQNRDLIIDESNIARNLFEKDFGQLAGRLSYEQYAPILFMWTEKLFTIFFGFSEQALKLYPLLTGITALFIFMLVLKEFVSLKSLWYPLLCFATAHFFIRYSTEIKQYMPDVLIVLALILLALKTDILTKKKSSFFLVWLGAGSVAVWSSMPSVFALAGIGTYYLYICIRAKQYARFWPFVAASMLCLAQFALYYFMVLAQDAHSEYLQNFHSDYFLVATPENYHEWAHNWYRISELVKLPTGYSTFSKIFNFALLFYGTFVVLRKFTAKGLLIVVPLFATIFAASINEFSVIPRVVLFTMPLFLTLIAVGFDSVLSLFTIKPLKIVLICLAIYSAFLNNALNMIWKPFYSEQATWALQLMKENGIKGKQLQVPHGSVPAYLYYTQIHPDKQRWYVLYDAQIRAWDANWAGIANDANAKCGVFFTTIPDKEAYKHREEILRSSRIIAKIERPEAKCYAYIFEK